VNTTFAADPAATEAAAPQAPAAEGNTTKTAGRKKA
jgi:hypothetical protein